MTALALHLLFWQVALLPDDVASQYEARTYTAPAAASQPGGTLNYRLLKPEKIEPGKKYPLLLFLHGAGERGEDNAKQLKFLPEWMTTAEYRQKFPCFFVAPQTNRSWAGRRANADPKQPDSKVLESTAAGAPSLADAELAVGAVKALMAELPIDPDRVYITGLSLGGYGTWAAAAAYPDLFAAAAPICGGGDTAWAARYKSLPIFAVHGDADSVVNVEQSRRMVNAVKAAGGNARLTELPGVNHDSWTAAYHDVGVLPWLFEQKKK